MLPDSLLLICEVTVSISFLSEILEKKIAVSIYRPLGYGPSTRPMRHPAYVRYFENSRPRIVVLLRQCGVNVAGFSLVDL